MCKWLIILNLNCVLYVFYIKYFKIYRILKIFIGVSKCICLYLYIICVRKVIFENYGCIVLLLIVGYVYLLNMFVYFLDYNIFMFMIYYDVKEMIVEVSYVLIMKC